MKRQLAVRTSQLGPLLAVASVLCLVLAVPRDAAGDRFRDRPVTVKNAPDPTSTPKSHAQAPAPIAMESRGPHGVTAASPEFRTWFAAAVREVEGWKFPSLTNRYGETITTEDFLRAIIWIESNGVHRDGKGKITKSWAGALGFGQLMPKTAKGLGIDPNDSRQNLLGMARYLKEVMNSQNVRAVKDPVERLAMCAAAYNIGPYSKRLQGGWSHLKTQGPAETVGYGLKLKMALGFPLTPQEIDLTVRHLKVPRHRVEALAVEYYAHSRGLGA
jgi:hypothetical protein